MALIVGSEDKVLDAIWRRAATLRNGRLVVIPMAGRGTDSLNAAMAATVLLYEAVRQRSDQSP